MDFMEPMAKMPNLPLQLTFILTIHAQLLEDIQNLHNTL